MDQAPTIKVPHIFQPHIPFRPIYLCLDETTPGFEHYSPLAPGDLDMAAGGGAGASAAVACEEWPPSSPASPARQEGDVGDAAASGHSGQASCALKRPAARKKPAGGQRSGWGCENFDAVKELLEQGVAKREISRRLGGSKGRARVKEIEKHIAAGTRPAPPKTAGELWSEEQAKNFWALGERAAAPASFQKSKKPSADLELQEQEWAAVAAWTFVLPAAGGGLTGSSPRPGRPSRLQRRAEAAAICSQKFWISSRQRQRALPLPDPP